MLLKKLSGILLGAVGYRELPDSGKKLWGNLSGLSDTGFRNLSSNLSGIEC
ncbi:hypothetical protein [Leptolyngbya sp. FACHB-671]|uniref:hypothetical protein n=1 Tax=Leptolyngbya sp. FACHB-671 TaxID=2692812 RepID=UPI001A7E24B9|nr:hypothetical protein [Leptolyngbya sp. FACHB-671]